MFSSVKKGKDVDDITEILPKKKVEGSLALDCIGVVMEFVICPSVVKNILMVSKDTKLYLEQTHPECCKHLKFVLVNRPSRDIQCPYVHHLEIVKSGCLGFMKTKKEATLLFRKFPNLKRLRISSQGIGSYVEIFKLLPDLRKLEVEHCQDLISNSKTTLRHPKPEDSKLITLRIDSSHVLYRDRVIDFSFLETHPRLEKIDFASLHIGNSKKKFNKKHFRNLTNLQILNLRSIGSTDDSIFEYIHENLEELRLEYCDYFKYEGFKHLAKCKKLESLYISECDNLWDEGRIIKNIGGEKPKHFVFVQPDEDMGDIDVDSVYSEEEMD